MNAVAEPTPPALPWFPMYVIDWLNSDKVVNLTPTARDAYMVLLCLQWRHESLPAKGVTTLLPRTVNAKSALAVLEQFFPLCKDGRRRNRKLDALRVEGIVKVEAMKARTAAATKAKKRPVTTPVTNAVTEPVTDTVTGVVTSTTSPSPTEILVPSRVKTSVVVQEKRGPKALRDLLPSALEAVRG